MSFLQDIGTNTKTLENSFEKFKGFEDFKALFASVYKRVQTSFTTHSTEYLLQTVNLEITRKPLIYLLRPDRIKALSDAFSPAAEDYSRYRADAVDLLVTLTQQFFVNFNQVDISRLLEFVQAVFLPVNTLGDTYFSRAFFTQDELSSFPQEMLKQVKKEHSPKAPSVSTSSIITLLNDNRILVTFIFLSFMESDNTSKGLLKQN